MQFFSKWGDLKFLKRYTPESPTVDYQNIEGFIGAIVASKLATYKQLKEELSLEDAFLIYEVHAVSVYNEHLAHEYYKNKSRG